MKKLTKSIALVAIAAIAGVNVYIMNSESNKAISILNIENLANAENYLDQMAYFSAEYSTFGTTGESHMNGFFTWFSQGFTADEYGVIIPCPTSSSSSNKISAGGSGYIGSYEHSNSQSNSGNLNKIECFKGGCCNCSSYHPC